MKLVSKLIITAIATLVLQNVASAYCLNGWWIYSISNPIIQLEDGSIWRSLSPEVTWSWSKYDDITICSDGSMYNEDEFEAVYALRLR